jgi:hypothetical protein
MCWGVDGPSGQGSRCVHHHRLLVAFASRRENRPRDGADGMRGEQSTKEDVRVLGVPGPYCPWEPPCEAKPSTSSLSLQLYVTRVSGGPLTTSCVQHPACGCLAGDHWMAPPVHNSLPERPQRPSVCICSFYRQAHCSSQR